MPLPAAAQDPIVEVAEVLAREVPATDLAALVESIKSQGQTPKDIDSRLLAKSGARLKAQLDSQQKRQARAAFLRACEERLAASGKSKD
jgi:hypothetical protein